MARCVVQIIRHRPMLDLADIPFFAALASSTIERIRPDIPVRRHARGDVILRMGEHGRAIHAIAACAVRVRPWPRSRTRSVPMCWITQRASP